VKIGIYGGTFNPPHLGHVTAARAVFDLLKLDKLLLIPAGMPPHKVMPAGSPTAQQRLEMTRLAGEQLGLKDKVEVLDLELRREGKSYTSDTLAALKEQYPDDELWLLMGTDMFLTIQAWHEPEKIFSLAGIAAFGRTEEDTEELFSVQREYLYRTYPQARLFTLTIPGVIDVSSTELREKLKRGEGGSLLPPAVYGYILREHLYETGADLKNLTLSQLRPVALSYLKHKRIPHVLGTEQEAIRLAERYGADVEKVRIAALLHDCTKKLEMEDQLEMCRHYGIELDELETAAREGTLAQLVYPVEKALAHYPAVNVPLRWQKPLCNGVAIPVEAPQGICRVYLGGQLLGLGMGGETTLKMKLQLQGGAL